MGLNARWYLTLVFQCSHFERPLVLHIFSVLPVKFKTSKISNKCHVRKVVHITCRRKRTTVSMISQIIAQSRTKTASILWYHFNIKMSFNQVNNSYERIMKHVNMSNSICYLETFKILIKWAGFYYKEWKYFAFFYSMSYFLIMRPRKSVKE